MSRSASWPILRTPFGESCARPSRCVEVAGVGEQQHHLLQELEVLRSACCAEQLAQARRGRRVSRSPASSCSSSCFRRSISRISSSASLVVERAAARGRGRRSGAGSPRGRGCSSSSSSRLSNVAPRVGVLEVVVAQRARAPRRARCGRLVEELRACAPRARRRPRRSSASRSRSSSSSSCSRSSSSASRRLNSR